MKFNKLRTYTASVGFSFIEIIGAMAILSIALVVLMDNQTRSMDMTQRAFKLDRAVSLAESKMSELMSRIKLRGIIDIKDEETGQFEGEDFADYSWKYWKTSVVPPDFAALAGQMNADAEGGESQDGGLLAGPMKNITQAWSQALFEIHVEVSWKRGNQEKALELVTHVIDPNASQNMDQLVQGISSALSGGGETED